MGRTALSLVPDSAGVENFNCFPPGSKLATVDLGDYGQLKSVMCFS